MGNGLCLVLSLSSPKTEEEGLVNGTVTGNEMLFSSLLRVML